MKPDVEYGLLEVEEFFREECHKLKNKLKRLVETGKMEPIEARKKYDMYLNVLFYLEVCIVGTKRDDLSGDLNFNQMYRFVKEENESIGTSVLDKTIRAFDSL